MSAIFSSTACQSVNGRSSAAPMSTSALVARIFDFRSDSKPDMTDSAMIGTPVPRNTPKMDIAGKTVNTANSAPRIVASTPSTAVTMPPICSRSSTPVPSSRSSSSGPMCSIRSRRRGPTRPIAYQPTPTNTMAMPTIMVRCERLAGSARR